MEIEICTNLEWWRIFGPLGDTENDDVRGVVDRLWRALETADHTVHAARGQRSRCGGWNRACTFRRQSGGIGTFDRVTDEEWAAVQSIYDRVVGETTQSQIGPDSPES